MKQWRKIKNMTRVEITRRFKMINPNNPGHNSADEFLVTLEDGRTVKVSYYGGEWFSEVSGENRHDVAAIHAADEAIKEFIKTSGEKIIRDIHTW